jgi:tRNA/rRNA methyltransferase
LEADAPLAERVVFVLVRPLQSGNVGAVALAMKNMGLRRLVVVAPRALDIDRARWMAPGAVDILDAARFVPTVAEAVADCHRVYATTARARHHRWPAVDPQGLAEATFVDTGTTGVLFGPEDHGLGNEDLVHAHVLLHIPTAAHASLNLSQASLLVAQALFAHARTLGWYAVPEGTGRRGGPARGAAPTPGAAPLPAAAGALDPLVTEWLATLELGTYFAGHEPLLVEGTLRRVLQRASLDDQEIAVLRGMLRKMRWRMQNPVG